MNFLITALMFLAPLAPPQPAVAAEVPDECYEGIIVFDPVECGATYGICGIEYEKVPCPEDE